MPKKMTMKQWEKSAMDKKADAKGGHGKEGSKEEQAYDRKKLAAFNRSIGKGKGSR